METQHQHAGIHGVTIPMMLAVIGAPVKPRLDLNETPFSVVVATPVGWKSAVATCDSFVAPEVIKGQLKTGNPDEAYGLSPDIPWVKAGGAPSPRGFRH